MYFDIWLRWPSQIIRQTTHEKPSFSSTLYPGFRFLSPASSGQPIVSRGFKTLFLHPLGILMLEHYVTMEPDCSRIPWTLSEIILLFYISLKCWNNKVGRVIVRATLLYLIPLSMPIEAYIRMTVMLLSFPPIARIFVHVFMCCFQLTRE